MSFCSLALERFAVSLTAIFLVSACSEGGQPIPLPEVEVVPPGGAETVTNQNISNPTLNIPATFEASVGDTLTLVWSDEFDGAQLDPETWFFATGDGTEKGLPGGWGNKELQHYLPDNAQLVNGVLQITARRELVEGSNYTSARINTEDRFAFKYGRIEASIKLPSGQGLWPAFWMLSQDSPYGTWAASGEIDIMEAVNLDGTGANEIYGTLHYGGAFPANIYTGVTYTPGPDVTDDFHTYALEWDETEIRWYFDDTLYAMQNSWSSTAAPYPAPFDQPFHILLNLAVGGNFPGNDIDSAAFPAVMEVDWVRVYSGEENTGSPANQGTTPDFVLFATTAAQDVAIPDYVQDVSGPQNFGSGATFDFAYALDTSFSPVIAVTAGNGYAADAWVAFVAVNGYASPIAAGYDTFNVKVKGSPDGRVEVKLIDNGADSVVEVAVGTYAGSTDLGDGWYELSIPFGEFSNPENIPGHTGWLIGPPGDQGDAAFVFLLTDVGFSNAAGGV